MTTVTNYTQYHLNRRTTHNISSLTLTNSHLNVLNKGLNFAPTKQFTSHDCRTFFTQYDTFSESWRTFVTNNRTKSHKKDVDNTNNDIDHDTLFLYRRMKFIKKPAKQPSKYQLRELHWEHKTQDWQPASKTEPPQKKHLHKRTKSLKRAQKPSHTIKPADRGVARGGKGGNSPPFFKMKILN